MGSEALPERPGGGSPGEHALVCELAMVRTAAGLTLSAQSKPCGMLPLSGDRAPENAEEFARDLHDGLAKNGVIATVVANGSWPNLDSLRVDLREASGSRPLPRLSAKEEISVASVVVSGQPVQIEGIPAHVHVDFVNLRGGFAAESDNRWQVVPLAAESGKVLVEVQRDQLEAALHAAISNQAEKHGATLKATKLELSAPTPRSVRFALNCTAKVFIASATLTVRGHVDLDQELNARISDLSVKGEGMVGSMAEGFIKPHLAEWNGRTIPLASYLAGGLALCDIHITVGETVRIEAVLGSAA